MTQPCTGCDIRSPDHTGQVHLKSLTLGGYEIEAGSISVAGQVGCWEVCKILPVSILLMRNMDVDEISSCSCTQETCISIPQLKLIFDTGRCPQRAVYQRHVFISHSHMDHIGGLPFHVATRYMRSLTTQCLSFACLHAYSPATSAHSLPERML